MLPWLLCVVLSVAVLALLVKVRLLQRSMDEIARELEERLSTDTNVLLSISRRDRYARRLAADLNRQLRLLRDQRRRFQSGDRELKEAVTNISHDLRTPLTAISGYMDLMGREDMSAQARDYLAVMKGRVAHLKDLTEELFRYSVILSADAPGEAEDISLNAALEESLAAYYGALTQAGIQPEVHMPETPVPRRLNRQALGRVLSNILSNAIKYSAGDLRIDLDRTGTVRFQNRAPHLDEVQVGRLFDRFYTVESGKNATGLGLAIARTLVKDMGGALAASYEDGSLCVTLSFPEQDH